jgi:hypothetical protein
VSLQDVGIAAGSIELVTLSREDILNLKIFEPQCCLKRGFFSNP